jgi:hypothetical protein
MAITAQTILSAASSSELAPGSVALASGMALGADSAAGALVAADLAVGDLAVGDSMVDVDLTVDVDLAVVVDLAAAAADPVPTFAALQAARFMVAAGSTARPAVVFTVVEAGMAADTGKLQEIVSVPRAGSKCCQPFLFGKGNVCFCAVGIAAKTKTNMASPRAIGIAPAARVPRSPLARGMPKPTTIDLHREDS